MNNRPRKITTSFLLPLMFAVLTILFLMTVYDLSTNKERLRTQLSENADMLLNMSEASAVDAFWSYNDTTLTEIGNTLFAYNEIATVRLIEENGHVNVDFKKQGVAYRDEKNLIRYSRDILKDTVKIGEIQLTFTNYYLDEALRQVMIAGLIKMILVSLSILAIILPITARLTTSIDRIATSVDAFAKGNHKKRIDIEVANHEIEQLALGINTLFETVEEAKKEIEDSFEELQHKEEELRISEDRYRYAVEGSNDAMWEYNIESKEIYISKRGTQIIGINLEEVMLIDQWRDFVFEEDLSSFDHFISTFINNPDKVGQFQYRVVDSIGSIHWLFCRGKAILNNAKQIHRISGFFTDITERVKAEETVKRLAYYDILTGLPNRQLLFERVNNLISEKHNKGNNGTLIFMDLDDFKSINDTKGHGIGDKLLVKIATRLESKLEVDMIARIGGDEFAFIKRDCTGGQAGELAQKIIETIHSPMVVGDHEFNMTCSLGIAMFPDDGEDVETLFMNSDNAMFQAKNAGKDTFKYYEHSMNEQAVYKIEMQKDIRRGIANHEFVLYYQPKINVITGKVNGVEALVRWFHPEKGLISPAEFIPMAEENGLIVPLGEYILNEACLQSVAWEKKGLKNIPIAVNISVKQFNKKSLLSDIDHVLAVTGMDPQLLKLEITESIAMDHLDKTIDVIVALAEREVTFSLDDFGTGYSSLNYLKNLPINEVKIDRGFIQSIVSGNFENVVIKAVIDIAHSLDLNVVAEGIETVEQYEAIKNYSCDEAQGYLFSKPLPAADCEIFIRENWEEVEKGIL